MHHISPDRITCEQAYDIVAKGEKLSLSDESEHRVARCRKYIDDKIKEIDRPIYGVTTGFGSLKQLQEAYEAIRKIIEENRQ